MEPGTRVFVKTSLGWLKGKYHREYNSGHGIEIEKVQRGSRRYLPKEATTIWPYSYRYEVIVEEKDLRSAQPKP